MDNKTKQFLLEKIEENATNFEKINDIQYRIRCPICGDSSKSEKSAHCYIKCDYNNPSEPLLYNCFKCNSHGIVSESFLKQLGLPWNIQKQAVSLNRHNKISYKKNDINIILGNVNLISPQAYYIEKRLKRNFNEDDLDKFKIVWNMENIQDYITNQKVLSQIPDNSESISFLSEDRCTLITRYFNADIRWSKLKLFNSDRCIYTIKQPFNILTNEDSYLYITEGIFDIISVYDLYNEGNCAYVATLGSNYSSGIDYAISRGIYGKNIHVYIFIDQDIKINEIKENLSSYKWLYKDIYIYQNTKSKDVGVPLKDIKLNHWKV